MSGRVEVATSNSPSPGDRPSERSGSLLGRPSAHAQPRKGQLAFNLNWTHEGRAAGLTAPTVFPSESTTTTLAPFAPWPSSMLVASTSEIVTVGVGGFEMSTESSIPRARTQSKHQHTNARREVNRSVAGRAGLTSRSPCRIILDSIHGSESGSVFSCHSLLLCCGRVGVEGLQEGRK